MSAPKLKQFPKRKTTQESALDQKDKHLVTLLKDQINDKIKNPEFAKKAARILEEMMGK